MSSFLKLLCLLQHGRVDLDLTSSQALATNSDTSFGFLPLWHDRLAPSTSNAAVAASNPLQGRFRGQAFGISDPLRNHVSSIGARFTFNFLIDPSQVTAGSLHRFMVETGTDGVFEHLAAVPTPGDIDPRTGRRPLARTLASARTTIDVQEIEFRQGVPRIRSIAEGGMVLRLGDAFISSTDSAFTDLSDEVEANAAFDRTLSDHRVHVGQTFRPTGRLPIRVRVRREFVAQAVGVFSDVRVRGDGVASLRSTVLQSYFQKVPEPGDPCFAVLGG